MAAPYYSVGGTPTLIFTVSSPSGSGGGGGGFIPPAAPSSPGPVSSSFETNLGAAQRGGGCCGCGGGQGVSSMPGSALSTTVQAQSQEEPLRDPFEGYGLQSLDPVRTDLEEPTIVGGIETTALPTTDAAIPTDTDKAMGFLASEAVGGIPWWVVLLVLGVLWLGRRNRR